jgi:hypothetical protein
VADANDFEIRAKGAYSETSQDEENRGELEGALQQIVPEADRDALPFVTFQIAKASKGGEAGLCGRHSLLNIFVLEHLDVKLQFFLDVQGSALAIKEFE